MDESKALAAGEIISAPAKFEFVAANALPPPVEDRFLCHNYEQARKGLKPGEVPVLTFQGNGAKHVLLQHGEHRRLHPKDRSVSPRQRRKEEKRARQIEAMHRVEFAQAPAP